MARILVVDDSAGPDDFVEWFPGVTREQGLAVLEHTVKSLELA